MSVTNMYKVEGIGELLEKKGLFTKQEIHTIAKDLKRKNLPADLTDLSAQRFTAKDKGVIKK